MGEGPKAELPPKHPSQAVTPRKAAAIVSRGDVPQLQLARAWGTRAAPQRHRNVPPAAPDSRQGRESRAVLQSPAVPAAPVPPRGPSSRVAPLCRAVPGDRRTDRAEGGTPGDPASPRRRQGGLVLPRAGGDFWRGSGFGEPWGVPAAAHLGTLLALTALTPHRSHGSLDEETRDSRSYALVRANPARSPASPRAVPPHLTLALPLLTLRPGGPGGPGSPDAPGGP